MGWAKKDGFEAAAVAEEECVKNVVALSHGAIRTGKFNGPYLFCWEQNPFS